MKKTILGFLVVILLAPSASFAATSSELEAQKIALLKQVIVLLQAQIKELQHQIAIKNGSVLGVSTSTVSTITPVKPVVKKRGGGGGGGGGSRNNQAPLTLDMVGTENTFTITANQPLNPGQLSLTLLNFPTDTDTPNSFVVQASLSNGGTADIALQKQSTQSVYVGTPTALPAGVTYTGTFNVLIPNEAAARNLIYSITYTGNGVTRTATLENEGYAILGLLTGTSEPSTSVQLHNVNTTQNNIYFARIQNTGYVSADISSLVFDVSTSPAQPLSSLVGSAQVVITNENSLTAYQAATRYSGVVGTDSITFNNLPAQVAGQSTVYVFLSLGFNATTAQIYPDDIKVALGLHSDDVTSEHTNVTNTQEITTTGDVYATTTPFTTGLMAERGSASTELIDEDTAILRLDVDLETLGSLPMYLENRYGNFEGAFDFHVEDSSGNVLHDRYIISSSIYNEEDSAEINGDTRVHIRATISPRYQGDYRLVLDAVRYTGSDNGQSNIKTLVPTSEIATDLITVTPVDQGIEELRLITDDSAPIEVTDETSGDNDDTAEFNFQFTLEAVNEDFFIANRVQRDASLVTQGFAYDVTGPDGAQIQTVATINASTNEENGGSFQIQEGQAVTFNITISLKTDTSGQYRITLSEINHSTLSDTLLGLKTIVPDPISLLRSNYVAVNASENVTPDVPVSEDPSATSTIPYTTYIEINESNNNPESTSLVVEEDTRTTDLTILAVDIEPELDNIFVQRMVVRFDTPGARTEDVVRDATIIIDGDSVGGNIIPDLNESEESAWYEFDTSALGPLEEDVQIEVEVSVDFNAQQGNFLNYQTIRAAIESEETAEWVASTDGELSDEEFLGTIVGNYMTLLAGGLVVDPNNIETFTETQGENDTVGVFEITMEVTAIENDFYFTDNVTVGADNTSDGFAIEIDGGDAVVSAVLSSSADEDSPGVFTVQEGETQDVTLTVTIDPEQSGTYRLRITEINFSKNSDGVTDSEIYVIPDPTDFRTGYITIQA